MINFISAAVKVDRLTNIFLMCITALETKVQELLTIRRESNEALQTQQLELQEQHE